MSQELVGGRITAVNRIEKVFGRSRVFLPVIHAQQRDQVLRNAEVAREGGADGIFLINQGPMRIHEILHIAEEIQVADPTWWVGINILGADEFDLLKELQGTSIRGLWTDNLGVSETISDETALSWASFLKEARGSWEGLYLSGVAFKYQAQVKPEWWGLVARLGVLAGADVVVTSGDATGSSAPLEKLPRMRESVGDHALGLASGISFENVDDYPDGNAFLVASSILIPGQENFDPEKLFALRARIHQKQ